MNPKIVYFVKIAAAFFLIAILACTPPNDPTGTTGNTDGIVSTLQNLPGKMAVALPKSLVQSGSSYNSMQQSRGMTGRSSYMGYDATAVEAGGPRLWSPAMLPVTPRLSGGGSLVYDQGRDPYHHLVSAIDQVKSNLSRAVVQLVLVDAVISENGLTPSSTAHQSLSVNVTRNIRETMTGLLQSMYGTRLAITLPELGEVYGIDDFIYDTATQAPFDYKFSMIQHLNYGGLEQTEQLVLYWDNAKKNVELSVNGVNDHNSDITPQGTQPYAAYGYSVSYDDLTKASTMIGGYFDDSNEFSYKFQIAEDPTQTAAHGVFLFFDTHQRDIPNNNQGGYSMTGVADDNGGYVQAHWTYDANGGESVYYKEAFNSAQTLTGCQYSYTGAEGSYQDLQGAAAAWASNSANTDRENYYYSSNEDLTQAHVNLDDSDFNTVLATGAQYRFGGTFNISTVNPNGRYFVFSGATPPLLGNDPSAYNVKTDTGSPNTGVFADRYIGFAFGDQLTNNYLNIFLDTPQVAGTTVWLYEVDNNFSFVSNDTTANAALGGASGLVLQL